MTSSRRPTALGPSSAAKSASRDENSSPDSSVEIDDESTTVDQGPPEPPSSSKDRWEEKTHREGARPPVQELVRKRSQGVGLPDDDDDDEPTVQADDSLFGPGSGEIGTIDEPTVEDQAHPMPPLSIVPPLPAPAAPAAKARAEHPSTSVATGRLVVTAGNDNGREFELRGRSLVVGRGIDCTVVLTDIAVSRKHLAIDFDGRSYTLRDMGSGNGTLINDRIEDGACQLQHGDRLELGNTVIRFEHPASKAEQAVIGWGNQNEVDEEASTLAGASRKPPLAAKTSSPNLDTPSVLRDLVLPGAPPGAAIPAAAPHAPLTRGGGPEPAAEAPKLLSEGLDQIATPTPQPFPPGTSSAMPEAANAIFLTQEVYGEELHPQLIPTNRNRIIIGLISAALGLVVVAIIATIMHGDDESSPTATSVATASTTDANAAGDETRASDKTKPGDKTKAGAELAVKPGDQTALPVSTWGTNEVVFASRSNGARTKMVPSPEPAPVVAVAPTKVAPRRAPVKRTIKKRTPKKRTTKKRATKKRATKKRATKKRVATKSSSKGVRKAAAGLYSKKQFGDAATTLKKAASSTSASEASKLNALAKKYQSVGGYLTKAKKTQSSNPTASMAAYRQALNLDKKIGNSSHATYIRLKLGAVAPQAAASYMAQKRYEAAKKAADAAVNYGAGSSSTVKRVRNALERKAGEFYKAAAKIYKKKPKNAKKLLRRVIKMVPPDSPWYAKAYKALNSRSKSRDDDE